MTDPLLPAHWITPDLSPKEVEAALRAAFDLSHLDAPKDDI